MLVKFKLKSWPKNNQNIKDIGVTLTKEKQQVNTHFWARTSTSKRWH